MRLPLLLTLITYGLYKACLFFTGIKWLSISFFLLPILILLIALQLRKKLKYQPWFTSKRNFLLDQSVKKFSSDIDAVLLYEKIKSVIDESTFTLSDEDPSQLKLLATTPPNFFTWGENIYIEILPNEKQIILTSTTIFGSYSWQRNTKNHAHFLSQFEASLTI